MLGYHLTGLCLRFFTGGEGRTVGHLATKNRVKRSIQVSFYTKAKGY